MPHLEKKREAERPIADESPVALRRALQNRDEDAAIDRLEHHPELVELQMPGGRWTLLHMASALLLERVAIWLLQHGADANRHAADGSTPVDVARLHCDPVDREHGGAAMTRLPLNHGALLQEDYEFPRSNRRRNRIVSGYAGDTAAMIPLSGRGLYRPMGNAAPLPVGKSTSGEDVTSWMRSFA